MTARRVEVRCDGDRDAGWMCSVSVRDGDRVITSHRVRVDAPDLDRIAPDSADPVALVTAAFDFLLEREPPQSILRSFDLTEIGRYFPGYESDLRRRLQAG
jgi:hypothetical protein